MKKINIEGIKRILKKGKMLLVPIALVGVLSFTGCGTSNSTKKDKLIEKARKYGIEMTQVDNNLFSFDDKLYRFDKFSSVSAFGEEYEIKKYCTPEEFEKIVGEENVSWNDIRETIKNRNFEKEMEKVLLDGVNNLEKKIPNVNLSVLNYNLKNLTLVDSNGDNFIMDESLTIKGQFDCVSCSMYLSSDIKKNSKEYRDVITHEILGHGFTIAHTELNGGADCCNLRYYANTSKSNNDLDSLINNYNQVGMFLDEGVAEMLKVLATGEKITEVNRENDGPYDVYMFELQLILSTTNTSLTEFINNGVEYTINKMYESGCPYPIDYLYNLENKAISYLNNYTFDENNMLEDIVVYYLATIVLNKEEQTPEELKKYAYDSIDAINTYIKPDIYDGEKYISWTNSSVCEMISLDSLKSRIDEVIDQKQYMLKF